MRTMQVNWHHERSTNCTHRGADPHEGGHIGPHGASSGNTTPGRRRGRFLQNLTKGQFRCVFIDFRTHDTPPDNMRRISDFVNARAMLILSNVNFRNMQLPFGLKVIGMLGKYNSDERDVWTIYGRVWDNRRKVVPVLNTILIMENVSHQNVFKPHYILCTAFVFNDILRMI
jgi:hypothetical protein